MHYLGIDLGGTNIALGILDENYNLIHKMSLSTKSERNFSEIVMDISLSAKNFAKDHEIYELEFVGVGVPGTIEPKTGTIIFANNLSWKNVDFISEFQKHWDIPVFISNDANCAGLAEAKIGAGISHSNFLMLTLGTGVGGAVYIDDEIYLGANGLGLELGHSVFSYNGILCNCGRRGCLEMYISVTALKEQTREAIKENPTSLMNDLVNSDLAKVSGKTAFKAMRQGDKTATDLVNKYIDYIATAISSLFSIYRSPLIIIGGGISNEGEYLLAPIRKKVKDIISRTDFMEAPEIVKAKLANDAGIIGAALLGCTYKQKKVRVKNGKTG